MPLGRFSLPTSFILSLASFDFRNASWHVCEFDRDSLSLPPVALVSCLSTLVGECVCQVAADPSATLHCAVEVHFGPTQLCHHWLFSNFFIFFYSVAMLVASGSSFHSLEHHCHSVDPFMFIFNLCQPPFFNVFIHFNNQCHVILLQCHDLFLCLIVYTCFPTPENYFKFSHLEGLHAE